MSKIIDISMHQREIDFSKVKNSGVAGVMCRCAYGGKKDINFEDNIKNAHSANLSVGAYAFCTWHYSSVSVNKASALLAAQSEADKVIAILQNHCINGPVSIDLELENSKTTPLTKDEMTKIANTYMDKLSNAGYSPVIYASISWFYDRMNISKIKYPLWVAYYNDSGFKSEEFPQDNWGNKMKAVKDNIWMWQYSSKGDGNSFGTSSQYVDLDHCYKGFTVKSQSNTETSNTQTGNNQVNASPDVSSASQYTVASGDTMTGIASKFGITLNALISANPQVTNINLIFVGQILNIPITQTENTQPPLAPPENTAQNYTVISGDTMSGIASKFDITLNALANANPQVTNINQIYVGQVLNIPINNEIPQTDNSINVGDRVRVKSGSKTYTGGGIASFVFNRTYTIDELKGDRAVLDKKGICTPVNISSLEKVN